MPRPRRDSSTTQAPGTAVTAAPRLGNVWWLPVSCAFGLTLVFWGPLWRGAGFVGGDLYPYYFPQKQFLVDCLRNGVLPLWNPLTGHGYPVLGESQTAACYPLNLIGYGFAALQLWDVQTAWNAVHLAHYVLAFLAAWWFAARSGLQAAGALLTATVYVYGWFPARAALEWAILGGVYLPLTLGCVEACFATKQARWLIGLGAALGLQLLGGHYQMAFYTWLTLTAYIPGRWWFVRTDAPPHAFRWLLLAAVCGIATGGVQLVPTWELKQRSQRSDAGGEHNPDYGCIPPAYLAQLVQPWRWYDSQRDLDGELQRMATLARGGTNRVEAHLYLGQAPLALALGSLLVLVVRRRLDRWTMLWVAIALASLLVATGTLQPVLSHAPGFSYFRGVGRIGVVTTLALSLLAGRGLDQLVSWMPANSGRLTSAAVLLATIVDLAWWPTAINYAVLVNQPPLRTRDNSPLRALLRTEPKPVRLYAPGANIANLLGVSATPVYLGLGPREYFDPALTMPTAETDDFHAFTPQRQEWLHAAGVTHILCFEPLEPRGWNAERVWTGFDPLLNAAWGRFQEPLYLYRLRNAPGRAYWSESHATDGIERVDVAPHRVTVETDSPTPGRLILAELAYPGWQVSIDGTPATADAAGMFRAATVPAGHHVVTWTYRPASWWWGLLLSAAGVAGLAVIGWRARGNFVRSLHTSVPFCGRL